MKALPQEKSTDPAVSVGLNAKRPVVLHARVVTSTGGGPEKTILNSPRFLRELGYDSMCLFLHPPNDPGFAAIRNRAGELTAPLIEIEDRCRFDWRTVRQAIQLCRDQKVAIWHAHDYKTNLIGLIARRFHWMKLITTAHGWGNFSGYTPTYYRMDKRWFLRRYEKVICVSSTVMDECIAGGVNASRCILIENAIDLEQFRRQRPIVKAKAEQFGAGKDQLVIGAIGRLAAEKGFDLLIAAFARVVAQGVDARLVIAGEGPDQALLRRAASESGVGDRIELVGFCHDTRAFLESLDIFVLSSLYEGLPNVVLEAMAVGTAVIATRVGGVARVVQNQVNGLLIDAENIEQIGDAILKLVGNASQRENLGNKAVETIEQSWSFRARMKKVVAVYADVLGESP